MARRMMVDFHRQGYPQFVPEQEDGTAKPCAIGVHWVHPMTLKTIREREIKPSGPKDEPLGAAERRGRVAGRP